MKAIYGVNTDRLSENRRVTPLFSDVISNNIAHRYTPTVSANQLSVGQNRRYVIATRMRTSGVHN